MQTTKFVSKHACAIFAHAGEMLQLWSIWTSSKSVSSTKTITAESNDRKKRLPKKPKVAQVSEMSEESGKESVSKIAAATVREILGEPEPDVSVKSLTIIDGILRMMHAAKQECDDGTWILADTGATHEPVCGLDERPGDSSRYSTMLVAAGKWSC